MSNLNLNRIYGFIDKKEYIRNAVKDIFPGIFVLKIWKPFPGLIESHKIRHIPEFYFPVLQKRYPPEIVTSASEEINKKCEYGFNAVAAEIRVAGNTYPVIRFKNPEEQACTKELLSMYNEKGIHFSTDPEVIESKGMIKIIKYFQLEKVGDKIYFDTTVPELGYFEIPYELDWDPFEAMTQRIRVDVALGTFDAAIGKFYMGSDEKNIVRIFNPDRSIRNLSMIKKEYLAAMSNPKVADYIL